MLLVDDQAGSKDLYPYIKALTADCILTRVDPPFGDIVWVGNGPDDNMVRVAVEYKKLAEAIDQMCGVSTRLVGHQVGGLVEHYDRRYLLVEGRVRTDRVTGCLQQYRWGRQGKDGTWETIVRGGRALLYRDFEAWLTTLEEQAQFRCKVTYDEYESARWVVAKHSWYTFRLWSEHSALKQFHVPPPPTASFTKPSVVRRVAKEFDGVGWDRSIAVEGKFRSVRQMVCASEKDWMQVDGIGKVLSQRIVKQITEEVK